jgi:hypothetical protein
MERIRNTFAILGVVSFIVLACSAVLEDESVETTIESVNTNSSSTVQTPAKYQVIPISSTSSRVGVLNTETGTFQIYAIESNGGGQNWEKYKNEVTFTH